MVLKWLTFSLQHYPPSFLPEFLWFSGVTLAAKANPDKVKAPRMTPTLRHLKVRTTRQLTHCSCCTRGYTDHQRNTTGGNIGWNASAAAERFREFFGNTRLQRAVGSFLGIWGLCNILTLVTHSRKFFKLPSDLSGFFQDYWGAHSKTQSSIVYS